MYHYIINEQIMGKQKRKAELNVGEQNSKQAKVQVRALQQRVKPCHAPLLRVGKW